LAQLVRALLSQSRSHWFESSIAHHFVEVRPSVGRSLFAFSQQVIPPLKAVGIAVDISANGQ
ncbi:hypothetical protein KAU45_09005, partial [bacterium]|nr:hypothetical protein [bacterium]